MTNNIPKEDENIILNKQNNIKDNINNNKNINHAQDLENNYAVEYSHEFSRGNVGVKFTNLEPNTASFMISLYKNLFFGMEFFQKSK